MLSRGFEDVGDYIRTSPSLNTVQYQTITFPGWTEPLFHSERVGNQTCYPRKQTAGFESLVKCCHRLSMGYTAKTTISFAFGFDHQRKVKNWRLCFDSMARSQQWKSRSARRPLSPVIRTQGVAGTLSRPSRLRKVGQRPSPSCQYFRSKQLQACFYFSPEISCSFHSDHLVHVSLLRKMIEKAWAWAQARGKVRTNSIHGEEEIQVVVNETFELNNADIEEVEQKGSIAVQEI